MMRIRHGIGLLMIVLLPVVTTGCLSSSGGSATPGAESSTFEGEVLAPGGELVQRESRPLQRLAGLLLGSVQAGMSGINPVAGITVELVEVDNDGNQVGEALAEAVTSSTGAYTLTLPEGVTRAPAANLVVVARGLTEDLRAQAATENVTVDPISEFVLRRLIDFKVPLDIVDAAEVVRIRGNVDKLNIDAGATGMESAFEALEEAAGPYLDNEAETIAVAQADDLSSVAGIWHLSGTRLEMGYRVNPAAGTFGLFAENSGFGIEALNGEPALQDGIVEGIGWFVEQSVFSGGGASNLFGPEVEIDPLDPDAEPETGFIRVLADGTLLVEEGVEERVDADDDFALRRASGNTRFRYAGEHLRVGLNRAYEELYGVTDDLLDEDDHRGKRLLTSLEIAGRVPAEDLSLADLNGAYGGV